MSWAILLSSTLVKRAWSWAVLDRSARVWTHVRARGGCSDTGSLQFTWMVSISQLPRVYSIGHWKVSRYVFLRWVRASSEYEWNREKGTLGTSQTLFIRNFVDRVGINKTSPIQASPPVDLRRVSDEEPVVDSNCREMVGLLM